MINVATLVTSTTNEFTPNKAHVPLLLLSTFSVFHKVHVVWRTYRRAKVYSNPNNFISLTAGHVVNYTVGDKVFVRISALCVLISKRILDVVRQMERFQTSYGKVLGAVNDEFPEKIKFESKKAPCFSTDIKYSLKKTAAYIKRIAIAVFGLIKEAFLLSMKMMDAIETFYLSPSTRNEGVQEMFVNSTKVMDKLEKNQKKLCNSLNKNRKIIEIILRGLNSSIPVDQFTKSVEETMQKTVRTYHLCNPTKNKTFQKILRILNTDMSFMLEQMFPVFFILHSRPQLPYDKHRQLLAEIDTDRFPKKEAITRRCTLKNH